MTREHAQFAVPHHARSGCARQSARFARPLAHATVPTRVENRVDLRAGEIRGVRNGANNVGGLHAMRRPTSSRNVAVGFVVVALAAPRLSLDDQEPAPRAAVDAAAAPVDGQLIRRGSNCVLLPVWPVSVMVGSTTPPIRL